MMYLKFFISIVLWLLMSPLISSGQAYYDFIPEKHLLTSRDNFFNFYPQNPDSALFYARKIAANPAHGLFLRGPLHGEFSSMFHNKTRKIISKRAMDQNVTDWEPSFDAILDISYQTLIKLESDSNKLLSNSAKPLLSWINVQRSAQDKRKLKKLINEFIKTQLSQDDVYYNNAGLYALYIYQEISGKKGLDKAAQNLLSATIQKLETIQVNETIHTASKSSTLYKRAWYRFIYASANNFMANNLLKKGQNKKALTYQKAAFEFSPDLTDIMFRSIYSTEKLFLHNDNIEPLYSSYVNNLKPNDNNGLLMAYTAMALKDPKAHKSQLENYYAQNFSTSGSFKEFWENEITVNLEHAPNVDLQKMGGGSFSSSASKGKWVLIDFWGTWCGPCREEHPELQKFHQSIEVDFSDKIDLYTIACKDTEEKVSAYMTKFNYSFPVAVSDGEIEKAFNIFGYPSKVLISPEGKFLVIPSIGIDWIDFVWKYASLE